ncbi:hypothetical protein [Craurococcus roseus]
MIEVILTAEDKNTASELLASGGERRLIHHEPLRSGLNLFMTSAVFACGPVEINMPGNPRMPGQVFGDLAFPDEDIFGTGRPIRALITRGDEVPPTVWELGGHRAEGFAARR